MSADESGEPDAATEAKVLRVLGPGSRLLKGKERPPASTSTLRLSTDSFLLIDIDRQLEAGVSEVPVDPGLTSGIFCSYVLREPSKAPRTLAAGDRRVKITCVAAGSDGRGAYTRFDVDDPILSAVVCHNERDQHELTAHECGTALGAHVSLVAYEVKGAFDAMNECGQGVPVQKAAATNIRAVHEARAPASSNVVVPPTPEAPPPEAPKAPWLLPSPDRDASGPGQRKQ